MKMTRLSLNLNYCKGIPYAYWGNNIEALPASHAIMWLMVATSFNRIFTREDMREFLFRIAVILDKKELTETWLIKDRFIAYEYNGEKKYLYLEDISNHVGIEILDVVDNYSSRDFFLQQIKEKSVALSFLSLYTGCNIIIPEKTGHNSNVFRMTEIQSIITPELIKKSEFFASDVLAQIPDEAFVDKNVRMLEKEKEIEGRRIMIRNYPVFDVNNYSDDVLKEISLTIFGEKDTEYYLSDAEDFHVFVVPWIHLAWLFAKNLMNIEEHNAYPKEGAADDFDINFFDDDGFNLLDLFKSRNLAKVLHLLKL